MPPQPSPPITSARDARLLVAQAKAGDREAYTLLYRRHVDEVYRFALMRLQDRDAAEDATQTTFVRALTALPTCRENAAFVGWLFGIARSVVTDALRARRYVADPLAEDAEWPDLASGPEEVAMQSEARRTLLAAREHCLSDRDRELFDLLLTELNDKQIAAALGRSHGAVRTAHSRLLDKLRECLRRLAGPPLTGSSHA
jgi:RNA polymerase sigma-70 factor, ECF subfamily